MPELTLPIQIDESGPTAGIATLRLEQPGKSVVVLDHELIRAIERAVQSLPSGVIGLVLASASPRVFIAGADLKAIQELNDDQLGAYLAYGQKVFGLFASRPYPTVAAINGAALGGGLEIAMHCDALVGAPQPARDGQPAKAYMVGLPEASLCICPGWGGTNLLPARIEPGRAIRDTGLGRVMGEGEARSAGLFDAFVDDPAQLVPRAKQWILDRRRTPLEKRDGAPLRWIGRGARAKETLAALEACRGDPEMGTASARAVMEAVDAGLARGWPAALEREVHHLVRLRSTPEGRGAIRAFFEKSTKK